MAQSSSLTRVSTLIAQINLEKNNTVCQRLKGWYKEGKAKNKRWFVKVAMKKRSRSASFADRKYSLQ